MKRRLLSILSALSLMWRRRHSPALHIDEVVERLESLWMPRLTEFGQSLMRSNHRVVAETFSHRHADVVHALGLSCYPVGSGSHDPRTVGLIVSVTAINVLSIQGYVQWQSPSFYVEGETLIYGTFEDASLAEFGEELQSLLSVLTAAVERGAPPVM